MSHAINKQNIFNFLKAESIVIDASTQNEIEILENKNIGTNKLYKVNLTNLNSTSRYWQLNPENETFIQPNSKKVESIIIEETNNNCLNIFLIEMKSTNIIESDVIEKFEKSLSWIYLLLNLLNHEEQQNIKVFGILVAQRNMNWNSRETLNILTSTSVRYKKKSFYTLNTTINIPINNLR